MKDRKSRIYCNIDTTATASVFLALLLVLWSMLPGSDLPRFGGGELVKSNTSVLAPGAMRDDALLVGISASGDLYFRSKRVSVGELEGILRDEVKRGAPSRVYLIADRRAGYVDVKLILSRISAAGIENVTVISR